MAYIWTNILNKLWVERALFNSVLDPLSACATQLESSTDAVSLSQIPAKPMW